MEIEYVIQELARDDEWYDVIWHDSRGKAEAEVKYLNKRWHGHYRLKEIKHKEGQEHETRWI